MTAQTRQRQASAIVDAALQSTRLERQRARDEAEIERHVQGRALHQAYLTQRLRIARPPATQSQLAVVARHLESIRDPNQVHTAEKPATVIKQRVVTLVDVMSRDGQLTFELAQAAQMFRDLFLTAMGSSKGVSSYGDYVQAAEPSKRLPISPQQQEAFVKVKEAALAAFGVIDEEGRWRVDEQLMLLVVPAIVSDKKNITQGKIGLERTAYKGRAQVNAAGGVVVFEVLNKLALYFCYRKR